MNKLSPEELSIKYDTTVSDINKTIHSAYNKMVTYLVEEKNEDIFDAVMFLRQELNMSNRECIQKLNNLNRKLLEESAKEVRQYDIF